VVQQPAKEFDLRRETNAPQPGDVRGLRGSVENMIGTTSSERFMRHESQQSRIRHILQVDVGEGVFQVH